MFQGRVNLGLLQLFEDNFVKRDINQFPVKCRTVKNGKSCPWKGKLQDVEVSICSCWYETTVRNDIQYSMSKNS